MLEARDKGGTLPHEFCWEGGGEGSVKRLVGRTCRVIREGEASLVEKRGMRERNLKQKTYMEQRKAKLRPFLINMKPDLLVREKNVLRKPVCKMNTEDAMFSFPPSTPPLGGQKESPPLEPFWGVQQFLRHSSSPLEKVGAHV